jgi:hypothetical protein
MRLGAWPPLPADAGVVERNLKADKVLQDLSDTEQVLKILLTGRAI